MALLPASGRNADKNLTLPAVDSVLQWLEAETNLDRLVNIHDSLWMAGQPVPPRPLHYQRAVNREIVIHEDMDMHLVWYDGRIYLKPLSHLVMKLSFWNVKGCPGPDDCPCLSHKLGKYKKCARGFVFSYVALMPYESDFNMAKEKGLLPSGLDWLGWRNVAAELLVNDHDAERIYASIHKRFHYGELRLNRLNKIYWRTYPLSKGYTTIWNQHSSFFQDNFGLLASTTIYIALVLTAMQVGFGTPQLKENKGFLSASYGFTVFAILGPLVAVGLMLVVFLYLFVGNYRYTMYIQKKRGKFGLDISKK